MTQKISKVAIGAALLLGSLTTGLAIAQTPATPANPTNSTTPDTRPPGVNSTIEGAGPNSPTLDNNRATGSNDRNMNNSDARTGTSGSGTSATDARNRNNMGTSDANDANNRAMNNGMRAPRSDRN